MRVFVPLAFALCIFPSAQAYLDYVPNFNLQEEVEARSYRVLPRNSHYSLALDADFFKPVFSGNSNTNYYKYDFYHGNGYWLDFRSEFKANADFAINLETDITHGTSSNGPTFLALITPRVGLTYRWHEFLGFNWEARLSDIGRQTIGTGLFIEQKETDGGYIVAKRDSFEAKVMVDGTGSFHLDGGVIAVEASIDRGLLGITTLIQETETSFHPPQYSSTLYSKKAWDNGLGYGVEYGGNQIATAGLIYAEYQGTFDRMRMKIKPQLRTYGAGILGTLPKHVQHDYVSYDQNDKPYTNLMDIFALGDHVITRSAEVNAEYTFNVFYRAYVESEFLQYDYSGLDPFRKIFTRAGFKFTPFKDRGEEFGFLVGNKYLIASTAEFDANQSQRTYSSPNSPDFENKPLFLQQLFWMINFSTKL